MKIGNCRGKEKKIEICKKFYINPIAHLKLLVGQEKQGCCGKLTNQYYVFEYRPIGDYKSKQSHFFVGNDCANDFLKIIKKPALSLFNPLKQFENQEGRDKENSTYNSENIKNSTVPFNKELLDAVKLLCIVWNVIPNGSFNKIIDFSESNPKPNYQGLIWFNDTLVSRKLVLRTFIDELKAKNDLRDFPFTLLNQYLNDNDIKNGIG